MRRRAFAELFRARLREFLREPEVVFWVFVFPVLLAVGLGIAFRDRPPEEVRVGVLEGPAAAATLEALAGAPGIEARLVTAEEAPRLLRLGKVALVVSAAAGAAGAAGEAGAGTLPAYELALDPTRPESLLARERTAGALARAAGRTDPVRIVERPVTEPGARYIDFLIPGLIGMNVMGGGMWGVGFSLVEMRSRQLLKRLVATPMRRSEFLGSLMASRMLVTYGQLALLLLFGRFAFGMTVQGSLALVALLTLAGAFAFSGLGLLVASRARKIETVTGLMNLVMLPMYVLSGVFFSWERFPEWAQPAIRLLPLTALNDALRAVILEGAGPGAVLGETLLLAAWGAATAAAGMRLFRWR